MTKLDIVLLLIAAPAQTAQALLANKDDNDTGIDDELAEIIGHFLKRLEVYKASKGKG